MFKTERQENIISLLKDKKFISVEELSKKLFSSPSSIRRDLTELEIRGLVERSYGGVRLSDGGNTVIPYSVRMDKDTEAKRTMADKAVSLISDGDVVFLDQTSSASFLAAKLVHKEGITVVTNNVEIVMHLSGYKINVICSGGKLCESNRNALIGQDAARVFSSVHAKHAFFSAVGITKSGDIYDYQYEEVAVRNEMFKNAEKVVFLCDSNKILKNSVYKQTNLKDVNYFVCENDKAQIFKKDFPHLEIL